MNSALALPSPNMTESLWAPKKSDITVTHIQTDFMHLFNAHLDMIFSVYHSTHCVFLLLVHFISSIPAHLEISSSPPLYILFCELYFLLHVAIIIFKWMFKVFFPLLIGLLRRERKYGQGDQGERHAQDSARTMPLSCIIAGRTAASVDQHLLCWAKLVPAM